MTTYRGGAVPQDSPEIPGESLACRECGTLTSHSTLAAHGQRCYPCFARYCRQAFAPRAPRTDNATVADMKTRVRGARR